jgi:CRP/FNR family transcriptional regulator, cyclic AMP receptor protein
VDLKQETEALAKVPLLSKLDASKLKLLAFASQALTYEDGEILFHAGEPADSLYLILEGTCEILAPTPEGDVVVGTLGPNELVGELAVFTNAHRSATIRVRGGLTALRISGELFLTLLAENPGVALSALRQVSLKLARSHRHVEELQSRLLTLEREGGAR